MRRRWQAIGLAAGLTAASFTALEASRAAEPSSGALSAASPEVTWSGNPDGPTGDATGLLGGPAPCSTAGSCDTFTLDVDPAGLTGAFLDIVVSAVPAVDYDLYVVDAQGKQVGSSASPGTPPESVRISAPSGRYVVQVDPFTATSEVSYEAKATLGSTGSAAAPLTPTRTFWFRSDAGSGYDADLAADPAATPARRAPAGSKLVVERPAGATTATARGANGETPPPGAPATPTFSLPEGVVASKLCLDVWVSSEASALNTGAFTRFHEPDGTAHPNTNAIGGPAAAATPRRLVAEVATSEPNLAVGADWSFVFGSFDASPTTLHYGSAERPSRITVNPAPGTCTVTGTAAATPSTSASPTYTAYQSPGGIADSYAEPTIGVNHRTGKVLFQQGLDTARITFDDTTNPPTATWEDVTSTQTSVQTLDPIVEVEPETGRAFALQLFGACSAGAVSDDDGTTWQPSTGCPQPHGADHQGVGSGPYSPNRPRSAVDRFPKVFYYCSQSVVDAFCGRSTDGAQTWQPSVPIWGGKCQAIHGHPKVSPADGTVYVPSGDCGGSAGLAVSEDGGQSYEVRVLPGTSSSTSHPAVAVGSDGTVYVAWTDAAERQVAAASRDRGRTWSAPVDVGATFGVESAIFPVAVAGDGDRAVIGFLGARKDGAFTDPTWGIAGDSYEEDATWFLYAAHTFDRGATWATTRVTPDPVQRGCLTTGLNSPCRNLLDFNGISKDAAGRALIAYADGCTAACVTSRKTADNGRTSEGHVARTTAGRGVFAAADGTIKPGSAPAVDPCAATTSIKDPAGDATAFTGLGPGTPGVEQMSDVDIVEVKATGVGGKVRFGVEVVDMPDVPLGAGDSIRTFLQAAGIPFTLDVNREVDGSTSATLSKPDPADPTGLDNIAVEGATSNVVFDPDTDIATVDLDPAKLGIAIDGVLGNVQVLWRRSLVLLAPPADEATGPCPLPVVAASTTSTTTSTSTTTTSPPPACTTPGPSGATTQARSTDQYVLTGSDGATWQPLDATKLKLAVDPCQDGTALITANADLWTFDAGFNQDLGVFVDGQLASWKESGGAGGAFSPNAASILLQVPLTAGAHTVELRWKANRAMPAGGRIAVGAGPAGGAFSPTRLAVTLLPSSATATQAVSRAQHVLAGSDGRSWVQVDPSLSLTVVAPPGATALVDANADLFTFDAGFNQDLAIFVDGQLASWKESGGSAGTLSPNAASIFAAVPLTPGPHTVDLRWKANRAMPANARIAAGAGPIGGAHSPTRLGVTVLPSSAPAVVEAVSTAQHGLAGNDGTTWLPVSEALKVTVDPTAASVAHIVAGADLWTFDRGINQDLGVFVDGQLVAWKESGGFAGTFSPNAAAILAQVPLSAGTHVVELRWKANRAMPPGARIAMGAGPIGTSFSPTRLAVTVVPAA